MKRKINKKTRIYDYDKEITIVVIPMSSVKSDFETEELSIYFNNSTLLRIAKVLKESNKKARK
jgi:hypothetical protein